KSYPGTRDFYPEDMRFRGMMFSIIEGVCEDYGYEKISGPILENFQIYAEKSGEEIAEKQLYVFSDKGDRRVAIRPELTPTIARMFAAKISELAPIQRWYSIENFMRYERPQKGRLREFSQVNIDLIGSEGSFADFELLRVAQSIFVSFNATKEMYAIKINNRHFVNDVLLNYVGIDAQKSEACARIIDKKDKVSVEDFTKLLSDEGFNADQIKKLISCFEMSFDDLSKKAPGKGASDLAELLSLGKEIFGEDNPLVFDFSVVRGLAYYTGLVFEAYDTNPDNPRALFGGGRYDKLIDLFHKSPVSGVGFAIGDVTFELFLRGNGLLSDDDLRYRRHVVAVDSAVPLPLFHKIADTLKSVRAIYEECLNMIEQINHDHHDHNHAEGEACGHTDQLKNIMQHLQRNAYYDSECQPEDWTSPSLVEIYPDPSVPLGKQLQYANKAKADYVWICGQPELTRGVIKRKSMASGVEVEFDLATFEVY
ncbi:MAG: histidine--tRNA ligase, partial [Brevinema sp.]